MKVQEFMTSDVHTLSPDSTAFEAWELLISNRIRQAPVVDDEDFVKGIVSRTDLLRQAQHVDFESAYEQQIQLDEVMTEDLRTISPDDDLEEAAALMYENRLSSLPVTEYGKLQGILSKTDMFRAMTEILEYK